MLPPARRLGRPVFFSVGIHRGKKTKSDERDARVDPDQSIAALIALGVDYREAHTPTNNSRRLVACLVTDLSLVLCKSPISACAALKAKRRTHSTQKHLGQALKWAMEFLHAANKTCKFQKF
jgi:hypothetical protein